MEIFKITIEDIEKYKVDIMTLFGQSYEKSFPKKNFDEASYASRVESLKLYINEDNAVVYGIKSDKSLAGFVWFFEKTTPTNKLIHINSFVVNKNFRRQGVGKALWVQVENYASQRGITEIELLVTKDNKEAVDFYHKRNFEVERFVMKKRLLQ